jgi:hypothetical protein
MHRESGWDRSCREVMEGTGRDVINIGRLLISALLMLLWIKNEK